ncbi:glycosyltransferase family 87 protein [uncultured Roseibium sp.]|uniref:glycosyltransferase family 87 protein n=1 Tax=uncultured Roseibium sp. TaxID=1936171 RepID=UPI0032174639
MSQDQTSVFTYRTRPCSSSRQASLGGPLFLCAVILAAFCNIYFVAKQWDQLWTFPQSVTQSEREDLDAFYRASELAQEGRAVEAYDPEIFRPGLSETQNHLIFVNPPHFLLFAYPMASFSYGEVKAASGILILASLLLIPLFARQPAEMVILFALSAGLHYTLLRMNISVVMVALIVFALQYAERRPVLAGLALAVATIKPQYGWLVPFFLLNSGAYRCFAVAAIGTVFLVAASVLAFGWDSWPAFLGIFSDPDFKKYALGVTPGSLSLQATVGKLGGSDGLRSTVQVIAMAASAGLVLFLPRRWSREARIGVMLLASAAVASSFLYYSWSLVCAGLLFMLLAVPRWPVSMQAIAGLVWMQPALAMLFFNIYPAYATAYSVFVYATICASLALAIVLVARQDRMTPVRAG